MADPRTADEPSLEETLVVLLQHGCTPQWTYSEEIARAVADRAEDEGLDIVGPVKDGKKWKVALA